MSLQLQPGEPLDAALQRLARERIEGARTALFQPDTDLAEAIHEARKRCKELRALLRLFRGSLGEATFATENARWRDIARELSAARDAGAIVETWERLCHERPERLQGPALEQVGPRLRERAQAAASQAQDQDLPALEARIEAGLAAVADWPEVANRFLSLRPGLERSYRQGRLRLRGVRAQPSVEAFHEWRKRIKDHWYHMRILQPLWDQGLGARRKALKRLSEAVGQDHDLAVFEQLLAQEPALFGAGGDRSRIQAAVAERSRALRGEALALGRRLFAERPRHHGRRMRAYWRAWREEAA